MRPFTGDQEKKIRLKNPPLRLVLCRVGWPDLTHLQKGFREAAEDFGSSISGYPLVVENYQTVLSWTSDGPTVTQGDEVYQWCSIDHNWNVILGPNFLSFYCLSYVSFEDFLPRLDAVLRQLVEALRVPYFEKIGIRYVNQVADSGFVRSLPHYLEPSVLGFAGLPINSEEVNLLGSQNQVVYQVEDSTLQVRSGIINAGQSVDPAIEPCDSISWVLDLDAWSHEVRRVGVDEVLEEALRLADINYDFFKLVTSDGFLQEFGGNLK